MKITVLTENTSRSGLPCEHGLSLYIEANDIKLLFDMGQSSLFAENAKSLGIDLSCVDIAVLSHGHYDHGGGITEFLKINSKAPVYMSRYAFEPHYNSSEKYIGLDTALEGNDRLIMTDGITEVGKGMTLYSCHHMKKLVDFGSFGLDMMQDGIMQPENFRHEHYLMIEEKEKRVLISGCSHRGIINIEDEFRPDVLIGGFHFSKLPLDDKLMNYACQLEGYDTSYYTCHCTGTEQYDFMKRYMGRLEYIWVGKTFEI